MDQPPPPLLVNNDNNIEISGSIHNGYDYDYYSNGLLTQQGDVHQNPCSCNNCLKFQLPYDNDGNYIMQQHNIIEQDSPISPKEHYINDQQSLDHIQPQP